MPSQAIFLNLGTPLGVLCNSYNPKPLGMYVGSVFYPVFAVVLLVVLFLGCFVLEFVEAYVLLTALLVETYAVFVDDLCVDTEPRVWDGGRRVNTHECDRG